MVGIELTYTLAQCKLLTRSMKSHYWAMDPTRALGLMWSSQGLSQKQKQNNRSPTPWGCSDLTPRMLLRVLVWNLPLVCRQFLCLSRPPSPGEGALSRLSLGLGQHIHSGSPAVSSALPPPTTNPQPGQTSQNAATAALYSQRCSLSPWPDTEAHP